MPAPYGSLVRYLFPALLLHGECGAGAGRGEGGAGRLPGRPRPLGDPEKPAGLRGGPVASLVGGEGCGWVRSPAAAVGVGSRLLGPGGVWQGKGP